MRREPLIGAHMSIAGGIHNAFEHGAAAGCSTIQVFLKNSSQWRGKALTDADRASYQEAQKTSGIRPVVAHSSYVINLATSDPALRRRSLGALIEELNRANYLGVPYLVMHPGAHVGSGETEGIARIASQISTALRQVAPPVCLLLETTAGQGTSIGYKFEHLAAIQDRVSDANRIGFCLDTCHVFAAGYDIRTPEGYAATIGEFHRLIGWKRIFAFHLNDCKKPLGSRVDRHTHIGQGHIGLDAFRCLINDRRFSSIAKILETPKGEDLAEDIRNLTVLRSLAA